MRMRDKKYLPITLNLLGYIQEQSGNTNLAMEYYRLAVKEAFDNGNLTEVSSTYMTIAGLFNKNKAIDSGFYYAKKLLL